MTCASTDPGPVRSEFASDPDYREVLEIFVTAVPERRKSLESAFVQGNYEALRTIAHQIKGAGGGFGFHGLSELAAELERSCVAPQADRVAEVLERTLNYMQRISM